MIASVLAVNMILVQLNNSMAIDDAGTDQKGSVLHVHKPSPGN